MTSKHRKGRLLQTFGDQNLWIFLFESFKNDTDVVHFKAEVIEGGTKTRAFPRNRETDHAVADMAVIGLVKALRDSFHAEYGFVQIRHSSLILGIEARCLIRADIASPFGYNTFPIGTRHNKPPT